jgi:hypothetical protein
VRWGVAGCCVLFALYCGYGFIASGELDGDGETAWKTGYAIAGILALVGAFLASRQRQSSD